MNNIDYLFYINTTDKEYETRVEFGQTFLSLK